MGIPKNGAISQVENLVGIKKIINSIRVRNPLSVKDIKQRISTAFHRMATVNARKIDVETSESKVILKGKVCSWAERRDAEKAAWTSAGVTSVENLLEVDANVFTA